MNDLITTAVGVLGPVMILFMGAFVLFIVIALLLPIFQLNTLVH
jgi:general secretion pathway protein F